MNQSQFFAAAKPMMDSVDSAMARLFGSDPTEEERLERLEKLEDEFIQRLKDASEESKRGQS